VRVEPGRGDKNMKGNRKGGQRGADAHRKGRIIPKRVGPSLFLGWL